MSSCGSNEKSPVRNTQEEKCFICCSVIYFQEDLYSCVCECIFWQLLVNVFPVYLNIKKLPIAGSPKSHCKRIQVLGIDARLILLAGPHKKHQNSPLSPEKTQMLCTVYIGGHSGPCQQEMKVVCWWLIHFMSFRFIYIPHSLVLIHGDSVEYWVTYWQRAGWNFTWVFLRKCTFNLVIQGVGFFFLEMWSI